jgi:hypothetical protein
MRRLSIAMLVVIGWLVLALAMDRLVLAQSCPACAEAAALELKLRLPAGEITWPPVSLAVLVLLPIVLFAVAMVPWRSLRSRQAWAHAIESWWEPSFWLIVALLIAIVAESVYIILRQHIPRPLVDVAQRFTLTGTVSVHVKGYETTTPLAMTASAAGLTGLVIGGYLFLQNGLNGVMRWFKA